MKKILTLSLLLVSGFNSALVAQAFEKYQVWLDSQEVDGKSIIVGWCMNKTTSPVHVKYEALVKFNGGRDSVSQATTLALPNFPTLLTKAVFTLERTTVTQVKLTLRNLDGEILASDYLNLQPGPQQQPLARIPDSPTPEKERILSSSELEIEGLILDETRSKLARDFYETFHRNWSAQTVDIVGQNITIRELPSQIGIGSVVIVEVNDRTITQLNLRPRADLIEDLAGQLVEFLEQYLADPANHTVIESDDLTGSGIY